MKISLKDLATKFAAGAVLIPPAVSLSVKKSALEVRDTAVKKFGTLQPAIGPFPEWEKLADSTIRQKDAEGDGDPLIGHYPKNKKASNKLWPAPLRNTIEIETEPLNAVIGTKDPLGPIHEYGATGTGKGHAGTIPPRPFLRPALYENMETIKNNIAIAIGGTLKKM